MLKADFLKSVLHEVNMLKKHATKEEISKLNFTKFDPSNLRNCIYGQMSGSCENERAKELMDLSCERVVHAEKGGKKLGLVGDGWFSTRTNETFSDINEFINGAYESQMWNSDRRNYEYYSCLETYILLKGAKIKEIFLFLKGESKNLEL